MFKLFKSLFASIFTPTVLGVLFGLVFSYVNIRFIAPLIDTIICKIRKAAGDDSVKEGDDSLTEYFNEVKSAIFED